MINTKWLRKKKNLTQKEFAEKIGITHASDSNWESGRSSMPDEVVKNVCKVLETIPNELFEWVKD